MPQPTKIPRPFADSGDKNSIPDSSGSIGFASWQEGFPAITSVPFAQGGVAPKRADFNGIFNALSNATVWAQQGGVYAYDGVTDYEIGNVALYNGGLYICTVANGPNSAVKNPTQTAYWTKLLVTESGTWTPTLYGDSTPGELVFSTATGVYVKVGSLVFIDARLAFRAKTSYADYPTGRMMIGGLPYLALSVWDLFVVNGTRGVDDCCSALLTAAIATSRAITLGKISSDKRQQAVFSSSSTSGADIQLSTTSDASINISGIYRAN